MNIHVSSIIQSIALIMQAIGIIVGANAVLEMILHSKYVNAMMKLVNVAQKVNRISLYIPSIHEYKISDDIDESVAQMASIKNFLVLFLVTNFALAFSLGLWIWLIIRIIQFVNYGMAIGACFWIVFVIWFLALSINNLIMVPVQQEIERKNNLPRTNFGRRLLKNYFHAPLVTLLIDVILCIMLILFLPSWILRLISVKVDFSKAAQRTLYYISYAAIFLLGSTILQLLVVLL